MLKEIKYVTAEEAVKVVKCQFVFAYLDDLFEHIKVFVNAQ